MFKFEDKPAATEAQLAEAMKLREEADARNRRAEESFERCDTDGFLSQWASNITADKLRREAKLLENAGHALFDVLCNADGIVIADSIHTFQNTYSFRPEQKWRVRDEFLDQTNGRKWIPVGRKSRVQKQLGVHEEDRWFPARVVIAGSGTGLSGCASARVAVERVYPARSAA